MKIAVTGATGFIGSYFVEHFRKQGHTVLALVRTVPPNPKDGVEYQYFDLLDLNLKPNLVNVDVLIHCAYLKKQSVGNAEQTNFQGTLHLRQLAAKAGVKRFIFLSSLSAHAGAHSHYGRGKMALEQALHPETDLILKPGLVLGLGGLFGNILKIMLHSHIMPFVGDGRQPLQGIDIADLTACLEAALQKNITGIHPLVADTSFTLREIAVLVRQQTQRNIFFLFIPFGLVHFALSIVEWLNLPFPASRENLLGLQQGIAWPVGAALQIFGVQPRPYKETVLRLVKEKKKEQLAEELAEIN